MYVGVICPESENQMEKKVENELATGIILDFLGLRVVPLRRIAAYWCPLRGSRLLESLCIYIYVYVNVCVCLYNRMMYSRQ